MVKQLKFLKDRSTVLIFTYAPAGLGHLRVTDALYHGLPEDTPHTILGAVDSTVAYFHRLTSIHPIARFIYEQTQIGLAEDIFTFFYRKYLRANTELIHQEILNILAKGKIKRIVIISTHFGLAHKIGEVKAKIEREKKLKVVLIVQVTDDSPQQIWYVPEADIIFVPSDTLKGEFKRFSQKFGPPKAKLVVNPYPLAPALSWQLSEKSFQNRVRQLTAGKKRDTHVLIPISGAAVGTDYFMKMMDTLHKINGRYKFHVTVKKTIYTRFFLSQIKRKNYAEIHSFANDREVVDAYEEEYKSKVISLEVTKPSEQSFKSLLNPTQIGGSILLFSRPIGRQEYDNLAFLKRHNLIPDNNLQSLLWGLAVRNGKVNKDILEKAKDWRGVRLLNDPKKTAQFINWCLEQGIFKTMLAFRTTRNPNKGISSNGVSLFWRKIDGYLKNT